MSGSQDQMPGQTRDGKQSSAVEHSLDSAEELASSDDCQSLTTSDLITPWGGEDEDRSAGNSTHAEEQHASTGEENASTTHGEEQNASTVCGRVCVGGLCSCAQTDEVGKVQWSRSSQIMSHIVGGYQALREWAREKARATLEEAKWRLEQTGERNQELFGHTGEPMSDLSRNALQGTIADLQASLANFERQPGELWSASSSTQVICDNPIMCAGLAYVPQCLRDWVDSEAVRSGGCLA